jgi:hypothetical protein
MGVFLVGAGIASIFFGALVYVRLFLSQTASPTVLMSSFVFRGKYCPHCGEPWTDSARTMCSSCGQSLNWRPEIPFCPYCGRLVPKGSQTCPHCKEDVGSRPVSYSLRKLEKKEIWSIDRGSKMQRTLRAVAKRFPLTSKELVYVIILTFAFAFAIFIGYVRSEPHPEWAEFGFFLIHYGFPFEYIAITTKIGAAGKATISLTALALDFATYFVVSFFIVWGILKIIDYMR